MQGVGRSETAELAASGQGRPVASLVDTLAGTLEAERPRWFLWLPVFMGLGIAVYFSLGAEPSILTAAALLTATLALRLVARRNLAGVLITSALLAMASGFLIVKLRTDWVRAPVLERTLYRADLRGIVELVEPRPERGERITLRVTSIEGIDAAKLPLRARVRTMVTTPGLKPGDAIRLKAKIGPPSAPALPGDFDFARAAWFQRLGATGYALSKAEIETAAAPSSAGAGQSLSVRWAEFLEDLRQTIGARVTAALPGERGAIANALITGARGAITEPTNAAFRDSGLFHILSISGLHMVVMAGAAFFGVRRLLALFPSIALHYPIKKWAAAAALIAAFAYLNISGSSVATVRSAVMIAIIFLAVLIDRPALAMRNVALSALLILVVTPESLLDAGFQMSFAAVISLIAVYEVLRLRAEQNSRRIVSPLRQTGTFFGGIVMSTLIASFSVAPLAAYHFHKTQQFAVLANLIAIPVCNVIVMPAGLLTLIALPFGLEAAPLWVMGIGIDLMTWSANAVASLPGAVGHIPAIPHLSLVLMVAGGLWLTLWQTRWRLVGFAIAALGLAVAPFQAHGDLLAGQDGALVAVRAADGTLSAVPGRHSGFELKRWLEHDGDARTSAAASQSGQWRCDAAGCIATLKGVTVAAVRHPSALSEDCARARVLILPFPKPEGCVGPEVVLEPKSFWASGTHVITVETVTPGSGLAPAQAAPNGVPPNAALANRDVANSDMATRELANKNAENRETVPAAPSRSNVRLRVETVAAERGVRPWTVALRTREPTRRKTATGPPSSDAPAASDRATDDDE